MKWETYKKLNKEQKEEWNFRFKESNAPLLKSFMNVGFVFISIFMFNILISFLILKNPDLFSTTFESVKSIIGYTFKLMGVLSVVLLILSLKDLFIVIWQIIQEWKWRKANNIK